MVVLNSFISAFINPEGIAYLALDLWFHKAYILVTSEWQIQEFREVSQRPIIRGIVTSHEVGRFVNLLRTKALVLETLPEVDLSPDPKDNPILSSAIEGQVQYIVSGDKGHMLKLKNVKGIPIIIIRELLCL